MTYLLLFIEFFKTGLFSVGGGLATIPFLKSIADRYPWFDREFLSNIIAISESTPGPIGINAATYAGFTAGISGGGGLIHGILGGIVSTASLVLPSIVVIIFVARIFSKFKENRLLQNAFYGIRPVTTGMIAAAAVDMIRTALFANVSIASFSVKSIDIRLIIMFAVLLILTNKVKIHPIFYIILSGIAGAVMSL